MKHISQFTNRHPFLSMFLGWLALFLIVLTMVPSDPPYVEQAMHRGVSRSST